MKIEAVREYCSNRSSDLLQLHAAEKLGDLSVPQSASRIGGESVSFGLTEPRDYCALRSRHIYG
jgi:hypothetical protein